MKNGFVMKKCVVFVFILALLCMLVGCYPVFPAQESRVILEPVGNAKMTYVLNEESGYYDISVEGTVKIPAGSEITCATAIASVYDADGNVICVVEDYIYNIDGDEIWRFCAVGSSKFEPISFKINEIYGY